MKITDESILDKLKDGEATTVLVLMARINFELTESGLRKRLVRLEKEGRVSHREIHRTFFFSRVDG